MKQRITVATIWALLFSLFTLPLANAGQVTSSLLIDLNAANPNSYSGSGSTWVDLAGGNDPASIVGSPRYEAAPVAGFVHNGTSQYETINDRVALQVSTTTCGTAMLWARVDTATAGKGLFTKEYGSGFGYDGYTLWTYGINGLQLQMNGTSVDQKTNSVDNVYITGQWTLFTYIACLGGGSAKPNRVYVNGTSVISIANTDGMVYKDAPFQIGLGFTGFASLSNIKVGAFAYYNRELSAQEIADSYTYYSNYLYEASTVSLSANGTANKGNTLTLTATLGTAGQVRFFFNGKRIPGCLNVASSAYPYTATCTFKPPVGGGQVVSATLTPTNGSLQNSTGSKLISVVSRTNTR